MYTTNWILYTITYPDLVGTSHLQALWMKEVTNEGDPSFSTVKNDLNIIFGYINHFHILGRLYTNIILNAIETLSVNILRERNFDHNYITSTYNLERKLTPLHLEMMAFISSGTMKKLAINAGLSVEEDHNDSDRKSWGELSTTAWLRVAMKTFADPHSVHRVLTATTLKGLIYFELDKRLSRREQKISMKDKFKV